MKSRVLRMTCMIIIFAFSSTHIALSDLNDETIQQDSNVEDAQVDNSGDTTVVSVSHDDPMLTNNVATTQETGPSAIDTATSLVVGYRLAGKNKEEIITTLTSDMGYTNTEAQIAYSKSGNQLFSQATSDEKTDGNIQTDEDAPQQTEEEVTMPELPAEDRVKEGITTTPTSKFANWRSNRNNSEDGNTNSEKKVTKKETDTVTQMLDEGYTIEQIAQGFSDNNYSTSDIVAVFNETGVSAESTYNSISTIAINKAEAKAEKDSSKSNGNFFFSKLLTRFRSKKDPEENKKDAKKNAIEDLLTDMKSAGYDVREVADEAAKDLKAAGLSTTEAYEVLKPFMAPKRPNAKFTSKWKKVFSKLIKKKLKVGNWGEAESNLAAAMMSAGYEKTEIAAEFRKTYKDKDVLMIMSAGETKYLESQNNQTTVNSTNTINNTNTQQDIIQRNTQSVPI